MVMTDDNVLMRPTKLGTRYSSFNYFDSLCALAKEPALRGISILLLEGGPRKEYTMDVKTTVSDKVYSNRVSAVSKSSVKLLQSVGAWQIIEDLGGCNAVKEMRVSAFQGCYNKTIFLSF